MNAGTIVLVYFNTGTAYHNWTFMGQYIKTVQFAMSEIGLQLDFCAKIDFFVLLCHF